MSEHKPDYILYGGEFSYYTGKVRPYMRFKDLNFEERPATRDVYKGLILPKVGAAIVPVIETRNGEVVQDSTDIIDYLEACNPECPVYPAGPKQKLIALLLEHYADEWLLLPAMHYRWTVIDQQYDFIMREFGAMSMPGETRENQIKLGEKISAPFRGSLHNTGITSETIPAIEQGYLELLEQLNRHFSEFPYLFGTRPSIADFALMGPLYAHLGRDPVPKAIMQERAPEVYRWVQRMNEPEPLSGDFLVNDEVPATLIPTLQTLCRDFLPDVLDVIGKNADWVTAHRGKSIPRYLGTHSFTTHGARGERTIHSYSQWMFQRAWSLYRQLAGDDKVAVDALLQRIGGFEALNTDIRFILERRRGQLELVTAQQ